MVRSYSPTRSSGLVALLVLMSFSLTSCSILNAMNCTPEITTNHFDEGIVGTPYEARIETTCGEWSQAMRVLSGTLPPGLEVALVGEKAGIKGTPTTAGNFSFTLQMVARPGIAKQYVQKDFSITVRP